MKNLLEKIIEDNGYENLGNWCLPHIAKFSDNKNLFEYQVQAIKNIAKTLHEFYNNENGKNSGDKKYLFDRYKENGITDKDFAVQRFANKKDKENGIVDKRYAMLKHYYSVKNNNVDEVISGEHFINRCALWMATGSGKSLVLIKNIELLDYLINQKLIPQNEIMLLLPREDLIKQFKKEIQVFNQNRERKIELVNLKNYENDKHGFDFKDSIKVYYYRSDLLQDD